MNTPYIEPHEAPAHACINANCGCDDLNSAGPCSEWCSAHAVERMDLESGKAHAAECSCGHALCAQGCAGRTAGMAASDVNR